MPIDTLIIDDEPLAREGLRLLLAADPEIRLVGEAGDSRTASRLLRQHRPALIFVDVQMPDRSGVELVAALDPVARPVVVFVTAHEEHALRAFDLHATDYLLKPFTDERFREALYRAKAAVAGRRERRVEDRLEDLVKHLDAAPSGAAARALVAFRSGGEYHVFRPAEIRWVEAQGDYLKLHAESGPRLVRETLQDFLRRLPDEGFVRVHKSAIVNLVWIKRLEHVCAGDYLVELLDGARVRVSRQYRDALLARLG
ncbi:MAG: response regulator transcription factor [Opitutaceae bacterium]|nr:response regulator transcription factor [Opitutaceae bacterium]